MMEKEEMNMVLLEKYYIKTRGIRLDEKAATEIGIKRVYNWTSDIDYMHSDMIPSWVEGLHDKERGEAVIVESAMRLEDGHALYISTCIVFMTAEMCNVYYIKNRPTYKASEGFSHLLN